MKLSPVHFQVLACTLDMTRHDSSGPLRACGLPSLEDLSRADWLEEEAFDRFVQAALNETLDQSFGLTAGTNLAMTRYGLVAPLVMSAPDLRQALEDILRFSRLLLERQELTMVYADGAVRLELDPIGRQAATHRFRAESVFCGLVQMLRAVSAAPSDLHGVYFAHAQPAYAYKYADVLGPRVSFDAPGYAVQFNPDLLNRKFPWHDPATYMEARTRAEAALAAMDGDVTLPDRLRDIVLSRLPEPLKAADAAIAVGLSERSLRRKLAQLDTSFGDIQQECQILLAKRLLIEGRQSIKQIAADLGFSSVSCFHRAFRRWTDDTPAGWRNSEISQHTSPQMRA